MTETNLPCHQIQICWKKMKTSSNTRKFFYFNFVSEATDSVSVTTLCENNSAMHE